MLCGSFDNRCVAQLLHEFLLPFDRIGQLVVSVQQLPEKRASRALMPGSPEFRRISPSCSNMPATRYSKKSVKERDCLKHRRKWLRRSFVYSVSSNEAKIPSSHFSAFSASSAVFDAWLFSSETAGACAFSPCPRQKCRRD